MRSLSHHVAKRGTSLPEYLHSNSDGGRHHVTYMTLEGKDGSPGNVVS